MQKIGKIDVCNFFFSIFVSLVPEVVYIFFNKIHSNDPDCNAIMKGKERLSEQDKNKVWVAQSLYFNALSLDF
jgi:hypothetical protein